MQTHPHPPLDPLPVLAMLRTAFESVIEDAALTIDLGPLDEIPSGAPIVDAEGRTVAVLSAAGDAALEEGCGALLATLVASYGYVLDADRTVRALRGRIDELERVAYRDPLTGLLNRRAWQEAIEREQARCARHPRPVAVVVIDLDGLKQLNDRHGHLAGDVLLRLTGGLLREVLRPSDVVARIGGDEFAALLVDVAERDPAAVADRIQRDLRDEGVPASVGVAVDPTGDRLQAAFQEADDAMYLRKAMTRRSGRPRR